MACKECYEYKAGAEAEAKAGDEARRKLKDLREAVVDVVGNALPHYDGRKVVSKRAMDRLAEALFRLDGGDNESVLD